MPRGFDDIPGSLPPDRIAFDLDLTTIPLLGIAESALNDLSSSVMDDTALWRDHLSLTGQIRTFYGGRRIKEQWAAFAHERQPREFKTSPARVSRPTPSSSWIDVPFTCITSQNGALVGNCSGNISLIPTEAANGWKIWMLRTMLENFEGQGHPDDPTPIFSTPVQPKMPLHSSQQDVSVLIIGAGQAGLSLAGRLGALNINYFLLENQNEIGWSWTGKYDSVRQHTIREMNNLPFDRTWKPTDPELLPAKYVAEGFKNYVEKYRINIWLGAEVQKCVASNGGVGWEVELRKGGEKFAVKTRHLVLTMGASLSVPAPPKIPDAASFEGKIFDLGNFKNSSKWKGRKGVVVGSATGGHDGSCC